jgi:hypothetical protein
MLELRVHPGSLEEIPVAELPPEGPNTSTYEYLGYHGSTSDEALGRAFSHLSVVAHADGAKTYVGRAARYPVPSLYGDGSMQSLTGFVDFTAGGEFAGWGRTHYFAGTASPNHASPQHNEPLIGNNSTVAEYRRQGFGERRLHVMNAASLLMHGTVLHSAVLFSEDARNLWLHLVEEGCAELYEHEGRDRFRFLGN